MGDEIDDDDNDMEALEDEEFDQNPEDDQEVEILDED